MLQITEYYESIEGEGHSVGIPTLFIRFAGCNYNCRWCDTKYANKRDSGKVISVPELTKIIQSSGCNRVSLTGGEPLIQSHSLLLELMKMSKYHGLHPKHFNLETNGSLYAPKIFDEVNEITMDIKPPSSGIITVNKAVLYSTILKFLHKTWFKIIIFDDKDLEFVNDVIAYISSFTNLDYQVFKSRLYLQPAEDSSMNSKVLSKLIKELPTSRYGVRLHKMLSIR